MEERDVIPFTVLYMKVAKAKQQNKTKNNEQAGLFAWAHCLKALPLA